MEPPLFPRRIDRAALYRGLLTIFAGLSLAALGLHGPAVVVGHDVLVALRHDLQPFSVSSTVLSFGQVTVAVRSHLTGVSSRPIFTYRKMS